MNNPKQIEGIQFMGENFRETLKFCGEGIRLFPLCKGIRVENAELDNHSQLFDFVLIDVGKLLKLGKYSMIT